MRKFSFAFVALLVLSIIRTVSAQTPVPTINGTPPPFTFTGSVTQTGQTFNFTGGSSPAFNAITSGTNSAASMVVGTNASLGVSGTGTITSTLHEFAATASTGGTTANLLVVYDGSTGNVTTSPTASAGTVGIAASTATSGNSLFVIDNGIATCIADNTVTAGDLLGVGTTTAGRCKDLGTAQGNGVPSNVQIIGKAVTGGSAAASITVQTVGAGHYGTLVVAASVNTTICSNTACPQTAANSTTTSAISGQANGVIPLATGAGTIGAQSHLDDGNTTAATITSTEPIVAPSFSTPQVATPDTQSFRPGSGATNPTYVFGWEGAAQPTGTCLFQFPNAAPTTGQSWTFAAPSGGKCAISLVTPLTTGAYVTVAQGGTGLGTLTAHAVQVGEGTSTPAQVGPDATTTHFLASGGSSADPAFRAIASGDMPTAQVTRTACASDIGPVTGDDGLIVMLNPATAITLTRFSCGVTGTTNAVLNLKVAGTALLANQTCTAGDVNTVNTTTWANGSSQCGGTSSCAVAAHAPVTVNLVSLSGTPTSFSACVDYTVN